MDVYEIVQTLKKEMRDYSLRKRKYIEKPRLCKLPLVRRKCTYAQLKAKYPPPWSYTVLNGIWRLFDKPRIQQPPGLPFRALFKALRHKP